MTKLPDPNHEAQDYWPRFEAKDRLAREIRHCAYHVGHMETIDLIISELLRQGVTKDCIKAQVEIAFNKGGKK